MNRRSFFRRVLGTAVALAAAPLAGIGKAAGVDAKGWVKVRRGLWKKECSRYTLYYATIDDVKNWYASDAGDPVDWDYAPAATKSS